MGARFCGGCGMPLAPRCPACGAESQADARFCTACGSSLAAPTREDAAARKVVTIVFADLVGSTALQERLDAESTRAFMDRYYRAMRGAVEAHRGTVTQLLGDGVKAVFGAPRVAEDDALRAVRAGVEMQRAFRGLASDGRRAVGEVGLRVAVHTGEVVAKGESEIIGDPVNVAARLQQEAREGDVLVGESTQRLVNELVTLAPFGTFALKGRAEPVTAWRVVSLEKPAGAAATPFVGRDEELRRLTAVYDAATAAPAARLAVLLGSPGLGKSRLLDELARQLEGRARVLTAQCNPAGGATFAPIAETLRAHLGLGDGDAALRTALDAVVQGGRLESRPTRSKPTRGFASREASEGGPPRSPDDDAERAFIAKGIGALLSGTPALPEEIFFVVRRLLSALATEQPVVLAIDDVQWAEPLLLDFTEHLVQWGTGIPLLVLVAARPELRDTRSSLTTAGGLVSDVVTLGGLDAGAAMRLAANVVGADTLPAAVAGRVLATSEGNPLFLRELVRMLVNDGTLRKDGERWTLTVDLATLEMPPTIQALLAARIERLRPEERLVLERASVVGRQFSRAAVTHLLPREAQADLDLRLEALRRSELVEADAGWLLGEPALRFHHVLIRDAAYRRVLRGTRAELHARFADWLETRAGDSAPHDETIGWHLEQAYQQLRELGPLDADGRALGERAGRRLAAAGRSALARDDLEPARSLLGRALDCLDGDDPARGDLALDWCEALLSAGDVATAAGALAELGRFTAGSARRGAWHTCFTSQLAVLADPKALRASAEAVVAAAEALAAAGDVAGEAKAHAVHAEALARLGEIGACEAALDKALAAARRAGDRCRANTVLSGAPLAALWGPSPVTRASGRCLDVVRVLRITQGAPAVEAVALRCQAVLETLRGRSDAARRMIASSRRLVEELGITQRLLEVDQSAGLIELLEGDAVAAERWLRPAYEGFHAHGLGVAAAQTAALLGRALLSQGRLSDAERLSRESEALAGDDFKAAIGWRGVRAEALAGRGEHAAALELARGAVEIAAATDDLLDHADARSALAVALRAAGRREEAEREEARAIELWEQKGATLLAERARREGARAAEPATPARVVGEALARFDELMAESSPARRQVRPNAATSHVARLEAVLAAGDDDALGTMLAEEYETIDHTTGATYGRSGRIDYYRRQYRVQDLARRMEPLATLGDSLAVCRASVSGSAAVGRTFDVGAFQADNHLLIEVDAHGRRLRADIFAANRLGDAIARLYERHAELLPQGPEQIRAVATARSIAVVLGPIDCDPWATAIAPTVEFVDHRSIGLFESYRGADAFLRMLRSLLDIAGDVATRVDDILCLRSDALLVRVTNSGTVRAGGGAYERPMIQLWVSGPDGLLARLEWFDPDRDAEALARFDELTAEPPTARPLRRPVRPNAATANAARLNTAVAARDGDALAQLHAEGMHSVLHATGVTLDRHETLAWWDLFFRDEDAVFRLEPLASLGASLALCRQSWTGSASGDSAFHAGAFERDEFHVLEADARFRTLRVEQFAPDRLGDAIARLYERYADLLPEGPERVRAAATARSVAALLGSPDRWPFAPGVEAIDHRSVGFGPVHGAEPVVHVIRALIQLSDDFAHRIDDAIGLRSDALLVRWTNSGTDRASGGRFERCLCQLWVFGADGLLTRWEQFDAEQETVALARFDTLTSEPPAPRPMRRRVRPNAATANAARFEAAVAARAADAIADVFSESMETVNHSTGATYGRDGIRTSFEGALASSRDFAWRPEPLASLGEDLALLRASVSASGFSGDHFDVGAFERQDICLNEVDANGRCRRSEVFAGDRLRDAVTRLYERRAELLPDGPARTRATAIARSVMAWNAPVDLERLATSLAPSFEVVDHRILGTWSLRGAEDFRQHWRAQLDIGDVDARDHEILALQPAAYLVRRTWFGTDRGGGPYEQLNLALFVFGSDGLVTRIELFDPDRTAEALSRFDELTIGVAPPGIENAATRALQRGLEAMQARDWEGFAALFAAEFRSVDRRRLFRLELDRDQWLASYRQIVEMTAARPVWEVLATRGDRLGLARVSWEGSDLVIGPSEIDWLLLIEVDARGDHRAVVTFDLDALDAAYAELDARYAAGEGAPHARRAMTRGFDDALAARDWAALARMFAPDLVWRDHRRLGLHQEGSRDEYLASLRARVELAPDARTRTDHVLAQDERHTLGIAGWVGTREGGPFEIQFAVVIVHDPDGRIREYHTYDLDQLEDARARYTELAAAPRTPWVANAATRAMQRSVAAWEARDWEGFAAGFAPGFRSTDRRRLVRLELDREWIGSYRELLEMTTGFSAEVLATRGERLAMLRVVWEGAGSATGPSEIESLAVVEVDGHGDALAVVEFDPDDLDAAYAELDERYGATRPPIPFLRARAAQDWGAVAALLAPDLVHEDHRRLGHETRRGAGAYIEFLQTLVDLAPDARLHVHHIEDCGRRALAIATVRGTWEGGAFENTLVVVGEPDAQERIRRLDAYDLEQLDEARARLQAPAASALPDPLAALIKPNAASAVMDRAHARLEARDWAAVRALNAEGARFEDRRGHALVSGDVDWFVDYCRGVLDVSHGVYQRKVVATAGDHICLERVLWTGGPADGRVEVEYLWLAEVDESGHVVSGVMFDPEDWHAATRDAWGRWLARDPASAAVVGPAIEFAEGVNDRDRDRMRAVLADELVSHDRRRTGEGRVDGADAYLDTLAVLGNLSPDFHLQPLFVLALERHGMVSVARTFGTLPEGGSWENWLVTVATVARGRITRLELFEIEAVDAALARLAELRPDPLRIPPNAATRARDHQQQAREAQDWEALARLCAQAMLFDDRRSGIRLTGDRETYVASARIMASARPSRTLLATAGEQLALERVCWQGAGTDGAFEIELLQIWEVDADGCIVALIILDPDDRRAASAEMLERRARSDGARGLPPAAIEMPRRIRDHDLAGCRAALPDDYVHDDHRRTGAGRLEGADAFIAWLGTLFQHSPDAVYEPLYEVAVESHGILSVAHIFGTLAAGGGAFELAFVNLVRFEAGRVVGAEIFELEDLELARARFAALRPDPLRIPPNAAVRAAERISELHGARDWEALRALAAPEFSFDDRQKRALLKGAVELWIQNLEFVSHPGRTTRELIGTAGDRVAIQHVAFAGESEGGAFEAELLVLTEVAADGRLRARISFDPEDRAAAFEEAQARFLAGEAASIGGQAPVAALYRSITRHDWETVRSCLVEDAVMWDRRALGILGTLDRDQWVESLRAAADVAPDWDAEVVRILRWNGLGRVQLTRMFGTRDGGPFENLYAHVILTGGDRVQRFEYFDVPDLDRALARFEELCAARA
jgi:class 3 adenylate cyclase/ketosteroid isomerase-like protein